MLITTPATQFLDNLAIPYRVFKHSGPITSLEQAARERGQQPDQIVRSILFRLAKNEYLMVLIAGARQVSWPALRRYIGKSRLSMASPEEVLAITGYQIGAVSPFGLPIRLRILADRSILQAGEISIGSGKPGVTIVIQSSDLQTALGETEFVSLAQE